MSDNKTTSAPHTEEKTFRAYTSQQGKDYAQHRFGYSPSLYQAIIDYHKGGGQLDIILDVGCGPGVAVRALAPQFAHAIGIDPSEGMISTARSLDENKGIRFEVSTAEDLGSQVSPPIADSSVDLIIAATAAHWFDMPRFWARAAKVLKPGGSVAIWTSASGVVHPSVPNAAAIQKALDEYRDKHIRPYDAPGNVIAADLYTNLPLPWTSPEPVQEFDEDTFVRKEWAPGGEFLVGSERMVDMETLEKVLGTASPITRWREAHPDAVGTENDVTRLLRREIEKLLHEAGAEKGKEMVRGSVKGVLLMVKKKA
ncbi:methyltransferase domain-containing protein [Rhizodiscina lignyota]|uniref:Methyltransferase domain-containing protein n=1 Tax=Rhizodiscina lignyota TaxID=1504668 RepID=A0A9P4IJ04_9PEZI|nr:methyltransferase domain-containing protein [Rhizodiscina lignyota]